MCPASTRIYVRTTAMVTSDTRRLESWQSGSNTLAFRMPFIPARHAGTTFQPSLRRRQRLPHQEGGNPSPPTTAGKPDWEGIVGCRARGRGSTRRATLAATGVPRSAEPAAPPQTTVIGGGDAAGQCWQIRAGAADDASSTTEAIATMEFRILGHWPGSESIATTRRRRVTSRGMTAN